MIKIYPLEHADAEGLRTSIKDIFDVVADHLGLKGKVDAPVVPVGEDDVPAVVLDSSETIEKLGWQAEVSFEETIRRQLEWYDSYGVNDIFSHLSRPKR